MLGTVFFVPVATGFLVGFFVPSRVWTMCLVPVLVIAVNVALAVALHGTISVIGIVVGIVIAYPTALSINRFMHD